MTIDMSVTILNFHGIGDSVSGVPEGERRYWCPTATWQLLADRIVALREVGIPVAVTFDDGNVSDINHALPILAERGLTAEFFACAGRIGHPGYLSASLLRDLRGAGMSIGSHGWSHVDLRRVDDAELLREAESSRAALSEASEGPVDDFAIPFGSYDRRVLRALRGYRRVYTRDGGRVRPGAWLQPRSSYVVGWTPETVSQLVAGRATPWQWLGRAAARGVKRIR